MQWRRIIHLAVRPSNFLFQLNFDNSMPAEYLIFHISAILQMFPLNSPFPKCNNFVPLLIFIVLHSKVHWWSCYTFNIFRATYEASDATTRRYSGGRWSVWENWIIPHHPSERPQLQTIVTAAPQVTWLEVRRLRSHTTILQWGQFTWKLWCCSSCHAVDLCHDCPLALRSCKPRSRDYQHSFCNTFVSLLFNYRHSSTVTEHLIPE